MKITTCARCGKKAEKKAPKYRILEYVPYTRRQSKTLFLCSDCCTKLGHWLMEEKNEIG